MPKRKDMRYWNVPVTPMLDDAVERAVRTNLYNTKSDLIREAVREKLARMNVLRELTRPRLPAKRSPRRGVKHRPRARGRPWTRIPPPPILRGKPIRLSNPRGP